MHTGSSCWQKSHPYLHCPKKRLPVCLCFSPGLQRVLLAQLHTPAVEPAASSQLLGNPVSCMSSQQSLSSFKQ